MLQSFTQFKMQENLFSLSSKTLYPPPIKYSGEYILIIFKFHFKTTSVLLKFHDKGLKNAEMTEIKKCSCDTLRRNS